MIDALKWQIRAWERDGRHEWLTRRTTFLWLTLHNIRDRFTIGRVSKALRSGQFPADVEGAVSAVCSGPIGAGIRPMQVPDELAGLVALVAERRPKRVLEIGTARGGTLCLLCRFAAPDAQILSIDLPYGRNGGGYPRWKERFFREFAGEAQELHLLRADSHAEETLKRVQDLVGDGGLDFILIDADHSYEGVKLDYDRFRPLVARGGLVAMHDILPNHSDPSIDVNRFWEVLEADPHVRTDRIVRDPEQGMYGIGVVHV